MVETLKLSPEQLPVWLGAGKRQGPPVYKGRRMVTAGGFYQDGGWGGIAQPARKPVSLPWACRWARTADWQ